MRRNLVVLLTSLLSAPLLASCGSEGGIGDELNIPDPSDKPLEPANPIHLDRIVQAQPPVVDVEWVIDNSCSMSCIVSCHNGTIVDNITENFPVFMQHFKGSGVDYHIGVVTMDLDNPLDDGKLESGLGELWIDSSVSNDVLAFSAMATQGTSGSGTEKGIGASYKSYEVHGDAFNDGFFRDGSSLHTIVMSNELDQTPASLITVEEYVNWYTTLRTPDKVTFNSIVCVRGQTDACPQQNGRDYVAITRAIGGIAWDIQDENWITLLNSLGAQSAGLKVEYFLTQVPVPGTLVVGVTEGDTQNYLEFEEVPFDGEEIGYVYSETRNSVTFVAYMPPAGSSVDLRYELASSQFEGADSE